MKIAISSFSDNLKDDIANIFGRCALFLIIEIDNKKISKTTSLKNKNNEQATGAGISAAKLLAENNIKAVISGSIGPRAKDVLNQFNIDAYTAEGKIENIIQDYINGKLKKIL